VVALLAKTARSGTPLAMTNAPDTRHGKRKQKKSKQRKENTRKNPTRILSNSKGGRNGE
jgi:hypothetical protein